MTFEDFTPGIERLTMIFHPADWTDGHTMEYYGLFQHWSVEKWNNAVGTALFQHKSRMPTPAHMREYAGESDDKGQGSAPISNLLDESGCDRCHRGVIPFEVFKNKISYEKYAACGCAAGDRVAEHMVKIAKLRGIPLSTHQARYDFLLETKGWGREPTPF